MKNVCIITDTVIHPEDKVIHMEPTIGAFRDHIMSGSEYLGLEDTNEHSTSLLGKLADALGFHS